MKKISGFMLHILKLIRVQNLIIIALTQYLFRYAILIPIMKLEDISPVFSNFNFALLVISTLLIAAAGYAINDYFDIRIDRINRPDKIVVGKFISRRKVMLLHTVLSIIAVLIGVYLSFCVGSLKLAAVNIVIATLLWMYSMKYKAYFLVGNLIVAFASGMTIVIVWLFEIYALRYQGNITSNPNIIDFVTNKIKILNFLLWAYTLFAFVISLAREIIKDIEDVTGDKKCGCSTIPVVIGISKTKYFLLFLLGLSVLLLSYISYHAYLLPNMKFIFWYLNIVVIIPLIFMGYEIIIAKVKEDYGFLSNVTKFIMVAGVLSMALIFLKF